MRFVNAPYPERAQSPHNRPPLLSGLTVAHSSPPPGLQVLATASHYWPLDAVDGIPELLDKFGNRTGHVNGNNISMCATLHASRIEHSDVNSR